MIIVEGMDNSGKSTLARHLSEKFELTLIKSPRDRTNIIEDALDILEKNPRAVLDRLSVISERVYGPILRGKNSFDGNKSSNWMALLNQLILCHPLIIYCRPPAAMIFDFGKRKQMDGVIEKRWELLMAYDGLIMTLPILMTKYNYTVPNSRSLVESLIEKYLLIGGKKL